MRCVLNQLFLAVALPVLAQGTAPMPALGSSWSAQWWLRTRSAAPIAAAPAAPQAWRVTTGQAEIPPAFDGTRIVVVHARPKRLQAIDATTGAPLWEVPFTGLLETPPQFFGNLLVFALDGGRLVVLEGATGALRHLLRLPALKQSEGSEALGRPRQLFPLISGTTLVAGWATPSGDPKPERVLSAFDLESGALRWTASLSGPSEVHPLVHGGRVILGGSLQIAALDLVSGAVAWTARPPRRLSVESAQLLEGRLVLRTAQDVTAFDAASGRMLWTKELPGASLFQGGADHLLTVAPRGMFNTTEWVLALDARTGQVAWEREVLDPQTPWVEGNRVYLSAREEVLALDLGNGRIHWRRELGGTLILPLALQGDNLVALHRQRGGSRALTLSATSGLETTATLIKDKVGPGALVLGPRSLVLPLPEGGLAAFP